MGPVAAPRAKSAGRAAKMPAAPVHPRNAAPVRREAQVRRNVVAPMDRAAPAQPIPRMPRLRGGARRSQQSGPHRLPAQYRLLPPARQSRLPQNVPGLPPRRRNDRRARHPKSASAHGRRHLPPEHRRARRLRQLNRPHLRVQPSSGLPQALPDRPMRSGRPVRVTRSDRTASAPVTSVLARTHPPRPQPRQFLRLPLQRQRPRLRRLRPLHRQRAPHRRRQHPLLLPRRREPSRRHQHRPRRHLSRQPLPRPSRWILPASASRTCAASGASVVRAAG